jgi:parvulin-like peptidyl-prolyl isomerase
MTQEPVKTEFGYHIIKRAGWLDSYINVDLDKNIAIEYINQYENYIRCV